MHPIASASRWLTAAEQNYHQIKEDTLSIAFLCQKCHVYVYDLRFVVENDHKPQIPFFSETIEEIITTNTTFPATITELQLPV